MRAKASKAQKYRIPPDWACGVRETIEIEILVRCPALNSGFAFRGVGFQPAITCW